MERKGGGGFEGMTYGEDRGLLVTLKGSERGAGMERASQGADSEAEIRGRGRGHGRGRRRDANDKRGRRGHKDRGGRTHRGRGRRFGEEEMTIERGFGKEGTLVSEGISESEGGGHGEERLMVEGPILCAEEMEDAGEMAGVMKVGGAVERRAV
ncbi:hypothetical protein KC19_VG071800 [Ceratodon purpureus]|uniref:Uncharacterized protein n=1 Tax=Ceratodon purpureus TaxID=3225 RepID=A0A8T0HMT3_CERPU|nr:hypothetical protein KC19_VG071800 [Ceratodon purpureus]